MKVFTSLLLAVVLTSSCQNKLTLTDIDGNEYRVIEHNGMLWMAENLRVIWDRNGKPVDFYYPDENPDNQQKYGLLYDFATACKVCPEDWRLPTNEEWEKLINLENPQSAKALKDKKRWGESANTNNSGFAARPAGYGNTEHPNQFGLRADFWSSTINSEFRWTYIFEKGKTSTRKAEQHKEYAYSVRCVKKQE